MSWILMTSKMKRRVPVDVNCLYIVALCAVGVVWSFLEESQSTPMTYTINTSTHMQQYCMCKASRNYTGDSTEVCCYFVERLSHRGQCDTDTEPSHNYDQSTGYSEEQPVSIVCVDVGYTCSLPIPLRQTEVAGNIQYFDERFQTINKTLIVLLEKYRNECSECASKISRVEMEFSTQMNDLCIRLRDVNETLNTTTFIQIDYLKEQLASLVQFVHANVSLFISTVELLQNEINSIKENHNEFVDRVNENDERLQTQTYDFKQKQNGINDEIKNRISNVDENVTEIKNALEEHSKSQTRMNHSLATDLLELKGSLLVVNSKIQRMYRELISKFRHVLVMLSSTKSEFKDEIGILNSSFNKKLTSLGNRLDNLRDAMESALKEQIERLKNKHEEEMSALREDIHRERLELSSQIQQLETANTTLTEKILQLEARFDANVALISKNVSSHKALIDVIYPNTFDKGAFVLVIMTLFVWIIVMTIAFCRLRSKLHTELQGGSVARTKDVNLTRALHNVGLEKKLGIVYFNPSTKEIISKVLQQLMSRLPKELLDRVLTSEDDWVHVKNHEDGRDLPNTKMCFLFAEFHERHVIIEEPGLGLGDLKRKTVQALKDAGVSIVIVYVRHSGSKQLGEDRLFHEEIHCALHQPELKVFADAGRFFSIYDTCSPYQAQNLCAILQDFLP